MVPGGVELCELVVVLSQGNTTENGLLVHVSEEKSPCDTQFLSAVFLKTMIPHHWAPTLVSALVSGVGVYLLFRRARRIEAVLLAHQYARAPAPRVASAPLRSAQTNTEAAEDEYIHVRVFDELVQSALQDKCAEDLVDDRPVVHVDENAKACEVVDELRRTHGKVAFVTNACSLVGILETSDIVRVALQPMDTQMCVRRMLRLCVVADAATPFVDILSYLRNGIRYIAVRTAHGYKLLSQRAIVARLMDDGCDLLSRTIGDLDLGRRRPLFVRETQCARDAFETRVAYGITSLPIQAENGQARGVISATDIFYAMRDDETVLETPVMDYLTASRAESGISRDPRCIVSCKKTDRLDAMLGLMMHENVHHVYVLTDGEACGVVSLVDVLKLL